MRRRHIIVAAIFLLSLEVSGFAQRRPYTPPPRIGGGWNNPVRRPIKPIPAPRVDPVTKQPIATKPPVIQRRQPQASATAISPGTASAGKPVVTAPVPAIGSPRFAQAKASSAAKLTQLRARLRSSSALSKSGAPPLGGGSGGGRKPPGGWDKSSGGDEEPPGKKRSIRDTFNNASDNYAEGEKIANGHAFSDHQRELAAIGIKDKKQFEQIVKQTMRDAKGKEVKRLVRGRTAYWNSALKLVVIHDPNHEDKGTAFVPRAGRTYFDKELK